MRFPIKYEFNITQFSTRVRTKCYQNDIKKTRIPSMACGYSNRIRELLVLLPHCSTVIHA